MNEPCPRFEHDLRALCASNGFTVWAVRGGYGRLIRYEIHAATTKEETDE